MTIASMGGVPEWTIEDRLRKARELTGLDQGQFADEIGISRGTVSNYEHGTERHKRPYLLAWAVRTGVPLQWLTGQTPEGPHPIPDEGLITRDKHSATIIPLRPTG